uniref:Uncharacterized protein At2g27790 n=1 Tax=Arabidopsis thaliana TaxID=3702 RepID=Q9ZUY0_ARATH|nr:hypothetical protein [Arabidopsis thaliana]
MGRYKDETPAVRVYTVCDESRYMIVRNVPALGCGDDLMRLFMTYGEVEEFAKRKLDESSFLGNRLQISYAPEYENVNDTKDKLESRRKEVLARLNPQKEKSTSQVTKLAGPALTQTDNVSSQRREMEYQFHRGNAPVTRVSSDQEYFASSSMNQTVKTVREKLNKTREENISSLSHCKQIEESGNQKRLQPSSQTQPEESGNQKRLQPSSQIQPDLKRTRVDNRRRI